MNFYITTYTPLYAPTPPTRSMWLVPGSVVTMTGVNKSYTVGGVSAIYCQVAYTNNTGEHLGYAYAEYIEPLGYTLPTNLVNIDNQTANPQDAAQYVVYNGTTQYNLCGPLAVAYVAGWKDGITWLLDKYKVKNPQWWKRIFGAGAGRGTDLGDLDAMLAEFDGYQIPATRFAAALHDPIKRGPLVTPLRVKNLLRDNYVIASCRIDSVTGRLRGQGVLHWVVLDQLFIEGMGGLFHIFNPFYNRTEAYSWHEWLASGGQPYGVVVPRLERA